MNLTGIVKISKREWIRELESYIEDYFEPEDTTKIAKILLDAYITRAAEYYDGKEVPTAYNLAKLYVEEGEWLEREVMGLHEEGMDIETWRQYCVDHNVFCFTDDYACVTDGYFPL